ncbi:flavodoxin domain-containing protein [Roseiflexus sp.]|uniref:flavodoxin domain-containing protein n=1 Tax=Roseiflexus sp. TaxID=2562120 RepID=UPI00398B6C1B
MPEHTLSRRDVLKLSGLALVGTAVACSGLGYVVTRTPDNSTPDLSLGKETPMSQTILVAYATRAGSTAEIAVAIGQTLAARGFVVDVKSVKQVSSLSEYQAVILGSAIRMGNWLPEAVAFVKSNQAALSAMPVALFTVHMLNTGDDEASRAARHAYLNAVRPLLNGAEEVYFEGKMDFSRLSFLDRFIANMVKAVEADRRDWAKIRSWAPAALAV